MRLETLCPLAKVDLRNWILFLSVATAFSSKETSLSVNIEKPNIFKRYVNARNNNKYQHFSPRSVLAFTIYIVLVAAPSMHIVLWSISTLPGASFDESGDLDESSIRESKWSPPTSMNWRTCCCCFRLNFTTVSDIFKIKPCIEQIYDKEGLEANHFRTKRICSRQLWALLSTLPNRCQYKEVHLETLHFLVFLELFHVELRISCSQKLKKWLATHIAHPSNSNLDDS